MPAREISQGEYLYEHGLPAQSPDDGIGIPTLVIKFEHPVSKLFEICDLRFEFHFRILTDARTTRKHDSGRQCGDSFQRGDDLPDVIILAQGAFPPTDKQVAGEEPASFRDVETDVIRTVTGRIKHLQAKVFRFDPGLIQKRTRTGRFGPAPE